MDTATASFIAALIAHNKLNHLPEYTKFGRWLGGYQYLADAGELGNLDPNIQHHLLSYFINRHPNKTVASYLTWTFICHAQHLKAHQQMEVVKWLELQLIAES